jgi:hypothetical protein
MEPTISLRHGPMVTMSPDLYDIAPWIALSVAKALMLTPPPSRPVIVPDPAKKYIVLCNMCCTFHSFQPPSEEIIYDCPNCTTLSKCIKTGDTSHIFFPASIQCIMTCMPQIDLTDYTPIDSDELAKVQASYLKHLVYHTLVSRNEHTACEHSGCSNTMETVAVECPICLKWTIHDDGTTNYQTCQMCKTSWSYLYELGIMCDVCGIENIQDHDEYLHCTTCSFDACRSCAGSTKTIAHRHPLITAGCTTEFAEINAEFVYAREPYEP